MSGLSLEQKYEQGFIDFTEYKRRKGDQNRPRARDPVVARLGIVAGHRLAVSDSHLPARFTHHVHLRKARDPKLEKSTTHAGYA